MPEFSAPEFTAIAEQFHFLRPWWLSAIIAVLLLSWLLLRSDKRRGMWAQVIAPELLPFLVDKGGDQKLNMKPWVLLGGIIACVALAGPTWSKKEIQLHKQNQPLIVLFDLSPSMLATDLKPDRLSRAKLKTIDLLSGYKEGSSALIAFAGEAHAVTPITDDANTIISQLPVLHPDIMPVAGSNPESAMSKAFELAENAGYPEGDILLVTDGLTMDTMDNLRGLLGEKPGFRLSILGVGTDEGAPIPLNEHGFARDSMGSIVIAKLRAAELAGLARSNGGVYQTLTGTDQDLQTLLSPIASRNTADAKALERNLDMWEDRGIWLVFLLLPLAVMLFRKGVIVCLLVLPMIQPPSAHAGIWDDLWKTRDQQALEKLNQGDPEAAAELFEDSQWQGVANQRKGQYENAAENFAKADSADASYNKGNALANAGKLEEAIEAYDQALDKSPGMEDATFNRQLVEDLLAQQQQQQNQENQQQGDQQGNEQGQSGGNSQGENSSSQDQSGQQQGENSSSNDSNEQGDQQADQSSNQQNDNSSERSGDRSNEQSPSEQDNSASPAENADAQSARQSADEEGAEAPPSPTGEEANDQQSESSSEPGTVQESDQLSEEERQNAEQWLRRVPDDPGGLLRRKFEYEARQRFREERSNVRSAPGSYTEERW